MHQFLGNLVQSNRYRFHNHLSDLYYWVLIRHSSLRLQLIIADRKPLGSDNCQTLSIGGDEGYNSGVVDENDSDADTISMNSPEFWKGANVENSSTIQNRLILKESTRDSTYEIYPTLSELRLYPPSTTPGNDVWSARQEEVWDERCWIRWVKFAIDWRVFIVVKLTWRQYQSRREVIKLKVVIQALWNIHSSPIKSSNASKVLTKGNTPIVWLELFEPGRTSRPHVPVFTKWISSTMKPTTA